MPTGKDIDEMISGLPRSEKIIVQRLRLLVQECLPKAIEKCYYGEGLPFYRHHRLICFIWPSSVFWGPKRTVETQRWKGVSLGFSQGNLMSNENGVLKAEGRKQVYVMYFHTLKEIDENEVRALLFEAGMIDEEFGVKKRRAAKKQNP